jgi:hypothetical protein
VTLAGRLCAYAVPEIVNVSLGDQKPPPSWSILLPGLSRPPAVYRQKGEARALGGRRTVHRGRLPKEESGL